MGLDELEEFPRKRGAAEFTTKTGTGTATFNAFIDAVVVGDSTTPSRFSEGVEYEVLTANHKPAEHRMEKWYAPMILGRRIYDWTAQTEFERGIRKLRRAQHERETAFERVVGKSNRGMEIRKMVADPEPVEDQEIDLPEGASLVPKMASEEKLRKAKYECMGANLRPIKGLEDADGTGEDNDWDEQSIAAPLPPMKPSAANGSAPAITQDRKYTRRLTHRLMAHESRDDLYSK